MLFPTNPDLADILGDTDIDFANLYFSVFFWVPHFQVPGFPDEHFAVNISMDLTHVRRESCRIGSAHAQWAHARLHFASRSKGPCDVFDP